ncbi:MAG: T9SS type A sorting domain-containing protein [Saprospiraceae bacterium]|nr:T9SS type A sorting domain-containing protein [Saprospiraceae bacterium]
MKKFFLLSFLTLLCSFGLRAQIVYEDFEGGTSDLAWASPDGTYNGVIANPGPDAVNNSGFVGSYTKAAGFGYSLFWVPSLAQPLDLTEYNQFKLKVWCSTATPILLKFEGPGQAVEKSATMTVAGGWNELSFDMSAGATKDQLTKIIIFFDPGNDPSSPTYYFDDLVAYKAERCYETFESPSDITWTGLNATYNGAIANPDATGVNTTATVGSITNNPTADYNFAFGTLASGPMDLTTFNQFKINVWSTNPTKVIFKLEGSGEALEKTKYLPVGGKWQEMTFDMSGASAFTTITKILIIFNPGKLDDSNTYYFDNICAVPNNCAGATANPELLDDFECNRNAAYSVGWDSLLVIKNPQPDGTNPSARVGEWHPVTGSAYSALVIANADPIDLSTRNRFGMKVWSPKTGNLLLKIEGGTGQKEIAVPMTETNKWVEYSVDFSDQVGKGHTRLVAFFNAGVDTEAGDIYYFDDVKLAAPAALPPLEDFQGGVHLGWQPLDQLAIHGAFTAPTANSKPNSVNGSTEVGCYSKGTSPFSTLQAFSLTNFDLSVYSQFNLDVLSPAGGGTVTMQLNSPTAGNATAEATVSTAGEWETLGFDFSAFSAVTDFAEVRLIFNSGTAAAGESWCIDNLNQSKTTVDPCKDVVAIPNIVSDFECQHNYQEIFYGASDLKEVNNPKVETGNGSLKVGEYSDPAGQPYAGIGYRFSAPLDMSVSNQLKLKVYSPLANVPFLFKLQGGQQVEVFDTLAKANEWHQFTIDFSGAKDKGNTELVIFFNVASDQGGQTYYIDDIRWSRADYFGCVSDYETPLSSFSNFTYFNNGASNINFEVVNNPTPAGANTSSKVGKFVEAADATIYFGMFADLESFVNFKGTKTVKMKVLMDHIGTVTAKTEIFGNVPPPTEVTQSNTKINEWEELTFDFANAPDDPSYNRFTIFFDIATVGTGTAVTSYFDDIVIGEGQCGLVSVFNPSLEAMKVYPNPVSNRLRVDNFQDVARIDIFNALGQRVATLNTSGDQSTEVDVVRFPAGVYSLTGFGEQGQPLGYAKFVKQ